MFLEVFGNTAFLEGWWTVNQLLTLKCLWNSDIMQSPAWYFCLLSSYHPLNDVQKFRASWICICTSMDDRPHTLRKGILPLLLRDYSLRRDKSIQWWSWRHPRLWSKQTPPPPHTVCVCIYQSFCNRTGVLAGRLLWAMLEAAEAAIFTLPKQSSWSRPLDLTAFQTNLEVTDIPLEQAGWYKITERNDIPSLGRRTNIQHWIHWRNPWFNEGNFLSP